ncbi:MAG: dihydrofolate reductase family protein [Candidatus Thorarchaeota archaeon]
MTKLIYSMITSLDGYIEDKEGKFDWAVPDVKVHSFINNLQRPIGTYLYGRLLYETMAVWETMHSLPELKPEMLDFSELWRGANKIVYSKTLEKVSTSKTRIERNFDPEMIIEMKTRLGHDILVGGPNLAAQALKEGLIDEIHLFVCPVLVGGGKKFFPINVRLDLELMNERCFSNGMIYVQYRNKI